MSKAAKLVKVPQASEIASASRSLLSLTPQLPTEHEKRMAEVDQMSAVCYADAEMLASKLRALSAEVDAMPSNAVPLDGTWEDSSAAHHIEELRQKTKTNPPTSI